MISGEPERVNRLPERELGLPRGSDLPDFLDLQDLQDFQDLAGWLPRPRCGEGRGGSEGASGAIEDPPAAGGESPA